MPLTTTAPSATRSASATWARGTTWPTWSTTSTTARPGRRGAPSFYYVRPDKAMRPWQVWRHVLGTAAAKDQLVFQEDDERFFVSVELTRSQRFVLVTCESKMASEVHYLRADKDERPVFRGAAPARRLRVRRRPRRPPRPGRRLGAYGPTRARTGKGSTISPCSNCP